MTDARSAETVTIKRAMAFRIAHALIERADELYMSHYDYKKCRVTPRRVQIEIERLRRWARALEVVQP